MDVRRSRSFPIHVAFAKLRRNRPLTSSDLPELERLLGESGVGGPEVICRAAKNAQGLGLCVRSLVGMDRAAAKEALARFTSGRTLTANPLEFVSLIVDHLTEHGVVEAARLYESPFTDITPHGPDGLTTTLAEAPAAALLSPRQAGEIERIPLAELGPPRVWNVWP